VELVFLIIAFIGLIFAYFELVVPFVKGEVKFSKKFPFVISSERTGEKTLADRVIDKSAREATSIAVLPFSNVSPEQENEYFSDGITDDVITHLSKLGDMKVISRTSVMQYKQSTKNVRDIGEELGVAYVLEGTVRKVQNRVRIVAQLIDAQTDVHLWAETYDRDLDDIFAIQSDVAQRIATSLKVHVTTSARKLIEKKPTENVRAYELYLKGRFFWNKRTVADMKTGLTYFRQAIERDPTYALAYAGIADSYLVLGGWGYHAPEEAYPYAREATLKALAEDSTCAEAHASLGLIKTDYDWDWKGAEVEFRNALNLNPSYVTARHWFGYFLLCLGRFNEAIAQIQYALDCDPLSVRLHAEYGNFLRWCGRLEDAIEQLKKAGELDPNYGLTYLYLGITYRLMKEYEKSIAAHQRAVDLMINSARAQGLLGYAYALSGAKEKALQIAQELQNRGRESYVPQMPMAIIYLGLGDTDRAFEWFDRAYEAHDPWIVQLKTDAGFAAIHSDPRYRLLLEKIGLEKIKNLEQN